MTRNEYLDALSQALAFLDDDARAAALSFYSEMLEDRIEEGLSEEAAVSAMDSPDAIAARLKNEHAHSGKQEGFDAEKAFSAVADFARHAAEEAMEATEEIIQGANTLAHAAAGRAEGAYHAIRDEIKKGENGDYDQHLFSCLADGIRSVSLIAQYMPIRIYASADDQIHLTYYSHPEDPYTVKAEGDVLQLYPNHPRKKHGLFSSRAGRHWWQRLRSTPAVELALPKELICALYANTSNAAIHLAGLRQLENISLQTSNARITAEDIRCQALEIQSCNARLALFRTESQSFIRGKTSNGRIIGENLAAAEIHLQTSNGNMHLDQCHTREDGIYTTSNGGIGVQALSGKSISLRTNNGAIRGTLPGPITAWQIDSGTSNGRNSLPTHLPGEKPLSVHTSNGNIDITFI